MTEQDLVALLRDLASWLGHTSGVTDVTPIEVTIGRETWPACRYTRNGKTRYYLVGQRPKGHQRCPRVCYTLDGCEWYVGAYLHTHADRSSIARKIQHPFGPNWMLMPWGPEGRIDDYEDVPYRRVKVTLS